DVHPNELCPPNKRYDLIDANKKIDFKQVQCPPESKLLTNIIKNRPLRFNIVASSSVPWIYMAQYWDTLKEDRSKFRLTFMLDKKELSLTLDDFRTILHLPQATDNNHDSFMPPPSFLDMEGLQYSLHHLTSSIPYPRFTKIIISHYMTNFPEISRRARDRYRNLKDYDIMKNIFNSGRYKDKVGMKIPTWMISEEIKHTEHYRMYMGVFGIDVPLTQSQLTESTQGMHRTPSAPRRSTRLTPPAPVPTIDKADEMILQDTLQVSLAEHKSREEQEARENVELVNKHLSSVEIEKMVEGPKNVINDSSIPRNDDQNILALEESRSTPSPTPIRSPRIHTDLVSSDTEKLQELTKTDTTPTPSSSSLNTKLSTTNRLLSLFKAKPARFKRYKSFFQELQGRYGYLFEHLKAKFLSRKSFDTLVDHLQEVMVESLPTMVDKHIKEQVEKQVPEQVKVQVPVRLQAEISSHIQQAIDNHIPSLVDESVRNYMSGHILHVHPAQPQTTYVPEQQYQLYLSMKNNPQLQQQDIAIWLALQMKFETLHVPQTTCRTSAVRLRDQDDPHDDAPPEGENSAKRQKTSEYEAHSYALDDDEIPTKQVSQDIMEEVSLTINETELKKIIDEMLRQRYPEAPALSMINQDLLYLKKGNSGPEKIVLSLHKFPAIIFNDVDIEERNSKWVNKCVKKFYPYARYGVEHWKNPHAKIFYIKRQKEPGKPKEVVYSNSKIIQVIKTYWELGHEHKFITEIVARRANECIVSITESDYKNLNKNDIEDIYLLIMNGKVPDYTETGIEKHKIVLEGLKSYNNDVKYDYIQRDLNEDEVEYLKLFEEEIEVRLKYRNQMRRWEMYVNGRPLGPGRECPE
ncbi:hypothetical protein Tco_0915518, partial [Tanacetum coccineum]